MPGLGLGALVALVLAGCSGTDVSWMPLGPEAEWTYRTGTGLRSGVESIKVTGPTSISGHAGFRLSGPMGTSQMAWIEGRLIASELAGTRFQPPILLLDPNAEKTPARWEGTVLFGAQAMPASAEFSQQTTEVRVNDRNRNALTMTTRLRFGDRTIESTASYIRGLGLVQYEERSGDEFLNSLSYVAGP